MLKFIKKSLILIVLITMKIIAHICKSIYEIYSKNKVKIKKYIKSFQNVLREELER